MLFVCRFVTLLVCYCVIAVLLSRVFELLRLQLLLLRFTINDITIISVGITTLIISGIVIVICYYDCHHYLYYYHYLL